jgi:hypothetical protein
MMNIFTSLINSHYFSLSRSQTHTHRQTHSHISSHLHTDHTPRPHHAQTQTTQRAEQHRQRPTCSLSLTHMYTSLLLVITHASLLADIHRNTPSLTHTTPLWLHSHSLPSPNPALLQRRLYCCYGWRQSPPHEQRSSS